MLAGLSLLAVREIADDSFHTVGDLQGTLGLPVLGAIPAIEVAGNGAGGDRGSGAVRRWIGTGLVLLALGGGLALFAAYAASDSADAPEVAGALSEEPHV